MINYVPQSLIPNPWGRPFQHFELESLEPEADSMAADPSVMEPILEMQAEEEVE